jgi:hypothetical protein
MSNVKSLDALDINGLAIFKENIVKKYLTPGAAPSVISQAVYRALQQYKKDVVRFYSAYSNLPVDGNPGTLYLVHKSVDREHTDKYRNTIWFTTAGYFGNYLICEFSSGYTIKLSRQFNGYFVLDLNDVDPNKVSYLYTYTSARNTARLYKPGTKEYIATYSDLTALSGNIVATTNGNTNDTLILPRFEYEGDIPDRYNVPDDEIWVYSTNSTLPYNVGSYSVGAINEKNEYGFFVLKKGIHFPSEVGVSVYRFTLNNSSNLYASTRDIGWYSIGTSADLHKLCGRIVTIPPYSAYPLFVIYPYDRRETKTTTEIISNGSGSKIPDDEVWFDSTCWPTMYVNFNGTSGTGIELSKNELGYYVLSKTLIDSVTISEIRLGLYATGNSFNPGEDYGNMRGWSGSIVKTFASSFGDCTPITNREQIYEFLGKIIYIARGHNTSLDISIPITVDMNSIPDNEVWIDATSFGDFNKFYLLQSDSYWYTPQAKQELFKNEYGYFVLDTSIVTNGYILFGTATSGSSNSSITSYLKCNNPDQNTYWLNPDYLRNTVNGKIITTAPYAQIVAPLANISGTYTKTIVEYIDSSIIEPEDTSDNKFVAYTYKNGKYVQVSSSLFDTSDLHLEDITDQVLNLTSTNPISNKAVCDGLRYKYDIANILATPVAGYDNIVSSSGIKAAIDRLVTWDDIECIPITGEEIHTLFATYKPIPLIAANYYRIVISGKKSEGANYLAKIFETETLTGLTFVSRSADGPSMSETLSFTEDDTGKYIPVTVTCANKYNSPVQFWPGNLFDESSDGYYRADTSDADMVLTIDIKRKLAMSTLRKLTFTCLAGRPYQTTIPPVEKLTVSVYGSIGGVDYPTFRENIVYTPNKVANDGVYTIDIFPNA